MSESNVPEVVEENQTTDIAGKDLVKLQDFLSAGTPGIEEVDETKVTRMFDLYLSGKTYNQISGIFRLEKGIVLYFSEKLSWFLLKQEYNKDLQASMRQRSIEAALMGHDLMLQILQMQHKKLSVKMNRYMASDNEEYANQINLKEIDSFRKNLELVQKGLEPKSGKGPLVGINVGGEGATVTRTGENTIEVTPKQKAMGNVLHHYANLRRESEKK